MKIFHVRLDSFKYAYDGHWSSLEKAMELLPKDANFRRALEWNHPCNDDKAGKYKDYEHNKNIVPVITIDPKFERHFIITIPGFKWSMSRVDVVPEVKEPGQPYQPAQSTRVALDPVFEDITIGTAYWYEIPVDEVAEVQS